MSIIMGWAQCTFEIGATGANDAMASSLTSVGKTKDKTTTLSSEDGEVLEMKASGGETVGREAGEGAYLINTRVIEPADSLYTLLGLGVAGSNTGEYKVKTHIINTNFSVKITPKNVGARGIKAPKCSVVAKPGYSEEEGHWLDLTFSVLHGEQDYWYEKFTVPAASNE